MKQREDVAWDVMDKLKQTWANQLSARSLFPPRLFWEDFAVIELLELQQDRLFHHSDVSLILQIPSQTPNIPRHLNIPAPALKASLTLRLNRLCNVGHWRQNANLLPIAVRLLTNRNYPLRKIVVCTFASV